MPKRGTQIETKESHDKKARQIAGETKRCNKMSDRVNDVLLNKLKSYNILQAGISSPKSTPPASMTVGCNNIPRESQDR